MPISPTYFPNARWHDLGDGFADPVTAATFPSHLLRFRNQRWAERVGLGDLTDAEWEAHFARFEALPCNQGTPLALRYHGHQFDVYNPELGDGRGFLFAQLVEVAPASAGTEARAAGRLLDLATKGSGRSPWSRAGDGRLTLKGGVREVLATEMLEALGVDTSKTFSLIETGESLLRGDEPSPTRSSVLVRLSHSHVRIGTFQRLAYLRDVPRLERLVAYTIANYFPELAAAPPPDRPQALLTAVAARCGRLAASYMIAGFVHGVLNSDNINVTGESFDYGPWRFLPWCDPKFTAAYFDGGGLYAYGRQPAAILRNVARLRDALRPLATSHARTLEDDALSGPFEEAFRSELARALVARLGLRSRGAAHDADLVDATVGFFDGRNVGFARFFFDWFGGVASAPRALEGPWNAHYRGPAFEAFAQVLEGYVPRAPDAIRDPYFAGDGPCDLLIDEVEAIWAPIAAADDWSRFHAKVADIRAFARATR